MTGSTYSTAPRSRGDVTSHTMVGSALDSAAVHESFARTVDPSLAPLGLGVPGSANGAPGTANWPPLDHLHPVNLVETTNFETWFGSVDAPLFGSVHFPASGTARGGVVICSPLGKEHINTYRGVRQLAERLSETGLLVLRFDYRGHGDSYGEQDDPAAAAHWVESIKSAVAYVRAAGVTDVSIVGLRAGALLAAQAAPDLGTLRSLVLWDPVLSGRSFLRQQTSLYRMSVGEDDDADPRVSIVGAAFAPEAAAALGRMKLDPDLVKRSTDSVLCMVRSENLDSTPVKKLADVTGARVVEAVRHEPFVSPPSFLFSVPTSSIDELTEWVSRTFDGAAVPVSPQWWTTARVGTSAAGEALFESIEYRGSDNLLTISTYAGEVRRDDAVIVMHNTAIEHRIGPVRLWVESARRLATSGVGAIRFDRLGTGDSGAVADDESTPVMSRQARTDVRNLVRSLEADPSRVMHIGMCSGSWHSAYAARRFGAAGVIALNMVNWSYRRRRTPVNSATIAALDSRAADKFFVVARDVRNWFRRMRSAIPYPVWRALGEVGLVSAPETVLAPLAAAGTRTVVMLSPADRDWFMANRGGLGLSRLRARGLDAEVSTFDRGDHSLYHRDLREAMSAAIVTTAAELFDLDVPHREPVVTVGVENI